MCKTIYIFFYQCNASNVAHFEV